MLGHRIVPAIFLACFLDGAAPSLGCCSGFPPLPAPRPAELCGPSSGGKIPDGIFGESSVNASSQPPGVKNSYRALLKAEAEKNGLPPDIADAVAAIESGYNPDAIGSVGEVGLMQVRPGTAAMLGFKGDLAELAKPDVNIRYGVTYLGQAWRLAGGDVCRALMKYRAGHGEEVMSPLSVQYCGRARAHLAAAGSPFAASVNAPLVLSPPLAGMPVARRRGPPRVRTAAVSRAFWAAHEARIKAITARIEAKWRRMASRY